MFFRTRVHFFVRGSVFLGAVAVVAGCSSSSHGTGMPPSLSSIPGILEPDAGSCALPGGPVDGPEDQHCYAADGGAIVQPTSAQGCYADAAPPGGGDGGSSGSGNDGGATTDAGDIGNCGMTDYGPTMYNEQGSDDDCKYDVEWTSTPICRNEPAYFVVMVTKRTDGSPLTGANPVPDVVLNCVHPVPNGPNGKPTQRVPSPEIAPGTYVVGPIIFDKPGKWVFRFHFDEECLDIADDSPHGHAAFWVNVP